MLPSPPARDLAVRIFAELAGGGASADGALGALTAAHERLGRMLSAVVGDAGYRAIFSRSMRKARAVHPCLAGIVLLESEAFLEPLLARLRTEDGGTIRGVTLDILTNAIDLLGTLIGEELTMTLLEREWPIAVAGSFS
jgi:hypothetical protein